MLEVSEKIKKAFMTDNVEKQFRITFPNGEHEDITNEQIEANSVSFTESLCSKDTLKFGLCEANVFKFTAECENIKGCVIEVFVDAYYNNEVFTIPYGVFTVDSCKRIAGTRLREVESYGNNAINESVSNIEQFRKSIPTFSSTIDSTDIRKLMYTQLPYVENKILSSKGVYDGAGFRETYRDEKGVRYDVDVTSKYFNIDCSKDTNIYSIDAVKNENYNSYIKAIETVLSYENVYKTGMYLKSVRPYLEYRLVYDPGNIGTSADERACFFNINDKIYMFINGFVNYDSGAKTVQHMTVRIPYKVTIRNYKQNVTTTYNLIDKDTIKLYEHNYEQSTTLTENIVFKRNIALPTPTPTSSSTKMANMYYIDEKEINSFNVETYCSSYLEVNGLFGIIDKKGNFKTIAINKNFALYPEDEIYPNDDIYPIIGNNYQPLSTTSYKDADYEEYKTHKYGYVRVTYLATDKEKYSITVECDSKYDNVYEMSNNGIFLSKIWTAEQVKQIINTYFYPNIKDIEYYPANVSIKGLPFIEAGDLIKVYADEGAFKTFVFRRTLQGEQLLTDIIEAKGEERHPNADAWISSAGIATKE